MTWTVLAELTAFAGARPHHARGLSRRPGASGAIPPPSFPRGCPRHPPRFKDFVGREKQQADDIVWMTVSSGYQLDMTRAWFACLAAFYEESSIDRVMSNSVFWVVTRTNDCFY